MTLKTIKFLSAAFVALTVGMTAASADILDTIKERGTLIVGVKADYKPYGFLDTSGAVIGIEPDLAADVAAKLGVEAPITAAVAAVVSGKTTVEAAMKSLLARPLKEE